MATEILMEKIEGGLHPVDEDGHRALQEIQENGYVTIKFWVPRNIRLHRLFFALVKLVWTNQKEPRLYPTEVSLREALAIAVGHSHEVVNLEHGTIHTIPNSISYGAMDQVEFKQFFEATKQVILDRILPGVASRDLDQQVSDMLRLPGPDQMER